MTHGSHVRRLAAGLLLALLGACAAAAPDERFLEVPGAAGETVTLRYLTLGEGAPIVLQHGYTSSARNWMINGIAQRLAETHRVLVLEARGHGGSDKPHDPAAYGVNMARDVVALLDHEGIERAHLVGYSMGGLIALKAITLAPERFLSAVIGGQGWSGGPTGAVGAGLEAVAVALEEGRGIEPLMHMLTPRGAPRLTQAEVDAGNARILAANDPLALAAAIRTFDELRATRAAVEGNRVPTLGIVGARDPLIGAARGMAEHLGAFREPVVFEGANHTSTIYESANAERFAATVVGFVAAHDSGTGP